MLMTPRQKKAFDVILIILLIAALAIVILTR